MGRSVSININRAYVILILTLVLVLNWVVVGTNVLGKTDLNLGLLPKVSLLIIELLQGLILLRILSKYRNTPYVWGILLGSAALIGFYFGVAYILKSGYTQWISGIRY